MTHLKKNFHFWLEEATRPQLTKTKVDLSGPTTLSAVVCKDTYELLINSPYPTVVDVTKAHQSPSGAPRVKEPGNS